MNKWEIFSWINVIILSIGSLIVFIFFLKDIKKLLKLAEKDKQNIYVSKPNQQ